MWSYENEMHFYDSKNDIVLEKQVMRRQTSIIVAGPGFAPGSRGYEPLEVLLLYPAIYKSNYFGCSKYYTKNDLSSIFDFDLNLNIIKLFKHLPVQIYNSFSFRF